MSSLFGRNAQVKLLEFFLSHPSSRFSLTETSKKTKLSIGSVYQYCLKLGKAGILKQESAGKTKYFSLNREDWQASAVKKFYNLVSLPIDMFLKEVKNYPVKKAVLFGSYARGEDDENSDIDLLVVGDIKQSEGAILGSRLSTISKKRFSLIIKTYEEYFSLPKKEPLLWKKISSEGVVLYGN